MGYGHGGIHTDRETGTAGLGTAFFLNLVFSLAEFIGGVWTRSVAILSDAVHDLGDSFSIGTAFWLERRSRRRRTQTFSYGYRRFSVAGALVNSVVLLAGSVYLLTQAIPRLLRPEPVNETGMLWLAVAGIVFNGLAVLRLRGRPGVARRTVMLHLAEDLLGWAAVLAGSLLIRYTGWMRIDPLLSLGICVFILVNVFRSLRAVFHILLQGVPSEASLEAVRGLVSSIPGVKGVHDVHVWTQDGLSHVASLHLVFDEKLPRERVVRIKQEAARKLKGLGVEHLIVETELPGEDYEGEHCPLE